jgi:uracil-DNA glycosylase
MAEVQLSESWKPYLLTEFEKPYMQNLRGFLKSEKSKGKTIFPIGNEFFNSLNSTPFDQVKVVILGQDPYHGEGEAHGLCFSVKKGIRKPPSLQNIFKELKSDLGIETPEHGYLQSWANQGVLLLNSILTVEKDKPASHKDRGWESFTDQVIAKLNSEKSNLAFVLWGSYAQKKGAFLDRKKHLVLESPHPSPLSAHRGFFGTKPFSKINSYLRQNGISEIDWKISD